MKNHQSSIINHQSPSRRRGLSLIEMLIALAITAALLTATMVAIDASFKAYAIAAESASTQTSTRMIVNRVLTMVRTSTAHGPMTDGPDVTLSQNIITSNYIDLIPQDAPHGRFYRIQYVPDDKQLRLIELDYSGSVDVVIRDQPIIGGVTQCEFKLKRRRDDFTNDWVLERGSIDFTVEADDDASLDIEVGNVPPVRVVASTMPRRLE